MNNGTIASPETTAITSPNEQALIDSITTESYFSPMIGMRIMSADSIMENEFIKEAIESSEPNSISYEEDHVVLMIDHKELAHFMHLAYQYSDKHLVVVLDGTFEYQATLENKEASEDDKELHTFVAQLMTITESHINK